MYPVSNYLQEMHKMSRILFPWFWNIFVGFSKKPMNQKWSESLCKRLLQLIKIQFITGYVSTFPSLLMWPFTSQENMNYFKYIFELSYCFLFVWIMQWFPCSSFLHFSSNTRCLFTCLCFISFLILHYVLKLLLNSIRALNNLK